MKEPTFRIENGRKIYTTIDRIDCVKRPDPKAAPPKDTKEANSATPGSEADKPPVQGGESDDPNIVSVHMRLMTADDAYPTIGWLGAQLVKYGHNDGAAVKQIPGLINSMPRPLPLMWDHSFDVRDKAGKVNDAYFENSSDIKPGVNAWARVNRNYDPKAALGLETGELDATSISVQMEKERSHPDMDWETFVSLAAEGSVVDGKQVAWLPTKAVEVYHHALVWSGADPNSGPRPIANSREPSAAEAVKRNHTGGIIMSEKKALEILNSVCKELGLDVILSEGSEAPTDLQARMKSRIASKTEGLTRYSEIEARLSRVKSEVLPADQQSASTMETLNAMIDKLPLAKHGETYLADLKATALKAFDGAKADPSKAKQLTAEQKIVRGVIESSTDLNQLKAWVSEYEQARQERFGKKDMRSTQGEEMPPVTRGEQNEKDQTGPDAVITAASNRMFGIRGEK